MPSLSCCTKFLHVVHHHRPLYRRKGKSMIILVISLWSVSSRRNGLNAHTNTWYNSKSINLKLKTKPERKFSFQSDFPAFFFRKSLFMSKSLSWSSIPTLWRTNHPETKILVSKCLYLIWNFRRKSYFRSTHTCIFIWYNNPSGTIVCKSETRNERTYGTSDHIDSAFITCCKL